jgi:type IV secretory pathway TraG/TraD family ATPase VirD4
MAKQSTHEDPNTITIDPNTIAQDIAFSPIGLMLLLVGGLLVYLHFSKRKQEHILARGQMATEVHAENARMHVLELIKKQQHNDVGSYFGTPNGTTIDRANGEACLIVGEDRDRVYTDATGGNYFQGINGSGKSFSGLEPQFRCFLDQGGGSKKGFPGIYYDIKFSMHSSKEPCPSARLGWYAKRRGYKVYVLAPGVPAKKIPVWATAGRINLLDFVRDSEDVEMARQLVLILLRNIVSGFDGMKPYFRDGCISAFQGLILLAKRTAQPDLLMVRQLLINPNLMAIIAHKDVSESVRMVFDAFLDAAQTNAEAFGGITSTLKNVLGNVLMPAIAPFICGPTNIPLDLDGNDLLLMGVDGERRDIVCPILAACIHLYVNRNLLRPRETPLAVSLDELGSVFLPEVDEWPNQYRSAGLVLQVATQSPEMLMKRYGREGAARIATGCANHIIFQSDYADAKDYAAMVGETDITYETTGKSIGKSGDSTSNSGHRSKISLIEAHELTTLPQGKALFITRASKDEKIVRVPFLHQVIIPEWDIEQVKESVQKWEIHLTRKAIDIRFIDSDFTLRTDAIMQRFGPFIPASVEEEENPDSTEQEDDSLDLIYKFLEQKESVS